MIKVIEPIRPKRGLSLEQFHDHWRHPHGTLARRLQFIRHMIQSHRIPTSIVPEGSSGFEGVAEIWLESLDDASNLASDRYYLDYVVPDNSQFADVASLDLFWGIEEVLQERHEGLESNRADRDWNFQDVRVSIKIMQFYRQEDGLGWCGENDRELGIRIGAFRHIRCRPLEDQPYGGVRELFWPTFTRFEQGVRSDPTAFAELCGMAEGAVLLVLQAERVL